MRLEDHPLLWDGLAAVRSSVLRQQGWWLPITPASPTAASGTASPPAADAQPGDPGHFCWEF